MDNIFEIPSFTQKVRKVGGSLTVTIDIRVAEYLGLKEEDLVKIMITKLEKKEE